MTMKSYRASDDHRPANGSLHRRGFLTTAGAAVAGLALTGGLATPARAAARAASPAASGKTFRNSLSVSPFTESVLAQVKLTDGQRTAATAEGVQRLFVDHGATEMFVRVATRRVATDVDAEHGVDRALRRGRLATKLRLPLNPELGLWAVYGDISHQPGPDFSAYPSISLPGPWESLTIGQMTTALRQYGALVARQILGTGACVNVWDLGNEVEFGVAGVGIRSFTTSTGYWSYTAPDGVDPEIGKMDVYTLFTMSDSDRIAWLRTHLWPYTARIFGAVAAGIRAVDPRARFTTHTSALAMLFPGLSAAFWQAMADDGFDVHELGTSYYPTSNAAVDQLALFKSTAADLHSTFGKQVFVAETGYPSGIMQPPFAWNFPVVGYPQTQQGEYEFLRDLTAWGASTGHLAGMRPWAPDYCTAGWQPMSHFTVSGALGTAEPVLDSIADGLEPAASG
ncbi:glycosyl hydrolase 53 family protein [Streptomyces mirabilis]|uniref:glycosyl hydrolase 53 family protein n=1 Tax=Streptomyces mirabilis TaxID=68239 RepID=UPI0033BE5BCC